MTLSWEWIFFLYVGAQLLGFLGMAWYYDQRDKHWREPLRGSVLFYCVKCEHVYQRKKGISLAPCARCGFKNPRLKF